MYVSAYLQRASWENYITIETPFGRCFLFKSGQYNYFNYPALKYRLALEVCPRQSGV